MFQIVFSAKNGPVFGGISDNNIGLGDLDYWRDLTKPSGIKIGDLTKVYFFPLQIVRVNVSEVFARAYFSKFKASNKWEIELSVDFNDECFDRFWKFEYSNNHLQVFLDIDALEIDIHYAEDFGWFGNIYDPEISSTKNVLASTDQLILDLEQLLKKYREASNA